MTTRLARFLGNLSKIDEYLIAPLHALYVDTGNNHRHEATILDSQHVGAASSSHHVQQRDRHSQIRVDSAKKAIVSSKCIYEHECQFLSPNKRDSNAKMEQKQAE